MAMLNNQMVDVILCDSPSVGENACWVISAKTGMNPTYPTSK
jgi:hypothetical protein